MGGIHIHSTQKDYSHNTVLFHLLFAGPLTLLPNIWFGIILAAQIKPLAVIVCLTRLSECFRWSPTGAFSSAPSMKLFCSHSLQVCLSSVFTRVMWTARTMVRATGLQALSSRGLLSSTLCLQVVPRALVSCSWTFAPHAAFRNLLDLQSELSQLLHISQDSTRC